MDSSEKPSQTDRFNFCMQVWGSAYVELLLQVGLPSQLAEGNLLAFPWLANSVYEIYTTRSDERVIAASAVFKVLARTIETRFVHIDEILGDNKWPAVRYCHQEGVKSADARDAALFFLCPDLVWPERCFAKAAHRIVEGYSAVLCPGLRTIRESLVPVLKARFSIHEGCAMPIRNRDLVKVCLDHLHPEMRTWFWDSSDYFNCPTYILFDVDGEGVSAFCYILHPIVLKPQVKNAPFRLIFDQDYLEAACPNAELIYIAQDSDEAIFFEISAKDAPVPPTPVPTKGPFDAMAWYGEWQYNEQHRRFVKRPIRIHHGQNAPDKWLLAERRGHRIVDRIQAKLRIPDRALLQKYPENLVRRIEARYRFRPNSMSQTDQSLLVKARAKVESSRRRRQAMQRVMELLRAKLNRNPYLLRAVRRVRGYLRQGGPVR